MAPTDPDDMAQDQPEAQDEPMDASGQEEEDGEGDVVMPDDEEDSSEEGEEDEEEVRRVQEGFIVDEDEEEEEEEEAPKKRRKRRKKHHREAALEDDDIQLLEENTRGEFKRKSRFTRLRHQHESESPPATSSRRRNLIESDDDLDNDQDLRQPLDINNIWEDDRRGDDDDMSDFIDDSDEEELGAPGNEEARERRRQERREEQAQRKRARSRPEFVGIDANAWEEIYEVFGDGHEYDWALEADEAEMYEEQAKPEVAFQDVFEPSEIRKRMLTDDDDLIRARDTPERMQLSNSTLSPSSALSVHVTLTEEDIPGATEWVMRQLANKRELARLARPRNEDNQSFDDESEEIGDRSLPSSVHPTEYKEAVSYVLRQIFLEELEVPHIWTHKRDQVTFFDVERPDYRMDLLAEEELWQISTFGQKYRSLLERLRTVKGLYAKFEVKDDYFEEEIVPRMDSAEMAADATEYLSMKYKFKKQDVNEFRFHDDDEGAVDKKKKAPSRTSAYELAKKSMVAKLAEAFGITSSGVVVNYMAGHHLVSLTDPDLNPLACAEQFADPDPSKALSPEELLRRARIILATELGKDPLLRSEVRNIVKTTALLTVEPTERGIQNIDEVHPFYYFKYLLNKPMVAMLHSPQFLHILQAEKDHLITVDITIPPEAKAIFERKLSDAFSSDNFSDLAKAWNVERNIVIQEVLDQHLLPAAVKWVREFVREEAEDYLADACRERLKSRLDAAPLMRRELGPGEFASSVLAISWGKGDPQKDAITMVFLDEGGRMRENTKIDNLHDTDSQDEFIDLLRRRRPEVIAIGGFSISTLKLANRVKEMLRGTPPAPESAWGASAQPEFDIPVVYVHDDVARLYYRSKRAGEEFSTISPTARYCIGLARYTQSPLNEFAALGSDLTAISLIPEQTLVPKEKLYLVLEQALVDITNKVGVDINRAVTDVYYQHILPFVCGLGPRKAQVLIKKIQGGQGGVVINRHQFIQHDILTTKIFLNASAFLRIVQERESKHRYRADDEAAPDPLDDTRVHPEDYELAQKMATDALELDEEDVHGEHASHVVTMIVADKDKKKKLNELNLDEFAVSLYQASRERKRQTLLLIRDELENPFGEKRKAFVLPSEGEVLTMLTGETTNTLQTGVIVSVFVVRIFGGTVQVRLDSGVEGVIDPEHLVDNMGRKINVKKGQTLRAVIVETAISPATDSITVKLSLRPGDLEPGDAVMRQAIKRDKWYWDESRCTRDIEMLIRKKRSETARTRRVVKHPNFHNFNTAQAEAYLEKQQRGDVVIRPSSKGDDHLAVTWKVDDKLYQHIDVTEINPDQPGSRLIVDQHHSYSDLDELIVNHVQAMSRRVEELMAHEKFKHGSEDDLHLFLKNFLAANPAKSMYGFCLNRKRPGHFNLCFLANKNSPVQAWPVRVTPEAYYLFDAPAGGVPELCDAFKVRHLHESQNLAQAAGGRTPFGAGMRTPARPVGATPGHMSVRQQGRTPSHFAAGAQTPYGGSAIPPYAGGVATTPYGGGVAPTPHHPSTYGYPQVPRGPPQAPPNLNQPPPRPPAGVWGQSQWS